jgi:hypothetical protein
MVLPKFCQDEPIIEIIDHHYRKRKKKKIMLGVNSTSLSTWMALDMSCEVQFECQKKFWLSSLYTNWGVIDLQCLAAHCYIKMLGKFIIG